VAQERLTYRWLVPVLGTVVTLLLGAGAWTIGQWAQWVTTEIHSTLTIRGQRIAELKDVRSDLDALKSDYEQRLRALENRPR